MPDLIATTAKENEPDNVPSENVKNQDHLEDEINQNSEESITPLDLQKQLENLEKQIVHSLISLLMKVNDLL